MSFNFTSFLACFCGTCARRQVRFLHHHRCGGAEDCRAGGARLDRLAAGGRRDWVRHMAAAPVTHRRLSPRLSPGRPVRGASVACVKWGGEEGIAVIAVGLGVVATLVGWFLFVVCVAVGRTVAPL